MDKCRRQRIMDNAWLPGHAGGSWAGEGTAALRQPTEQMLEAARAAADAFNEINSPNENASKEVYE